MVRKIICSFLFFFCSQIFAAEIYNAHVVGVTDGDTVWVLRGGYERVKIRLSGIDCPEKKQPWGMQAKKALSTLVYDKDVSVHDEGKDRYQRTLAKIYIDGLNVGKALVRDGNCWVYTRYNKDKSYVALEKSARKAGLGLWRLPEAERVPPWEWRRKR